MKGDAFDFSQLMRPADDAASATDGLRQAATRSSHSAKPPDNDEQRRDLETRLQAKLREIDAHDSTVIGGQTGETASSVQNSQPTLSAHRERMRKLRDESEVLRGQLNTLIFGRRSDGAATQPTQQPTQPTQRPSSSGAAGSSRSHAQEEDSEDEEGSDDEEAAADAAAAATFADMSSDDDDGGDGDVLGDEEYVDDDELDPDDGLG